MKRKCGAGISTSGCKPERDEAEVFGRKKNSVKAVADCFTAHTVFPFRDILFREIRFSPIPYCCDVSSFISES